MNNPIPKYFDHPDKSVRYIEWIALNKFHFKSAENRLGDNISILDAYPEYDQNWAYWNDHFVTESRKRPNGTKNKLYLKIVNGQFASLDEVYVAIKKLTKPTDRGNSLKDAKKKVAQKAYAQEKYGDAFVSNNALVSAVKSVASEIAFQNVTSEYMFAKVNELVALHCSDEQLTEAQINTLTGLCERRVDKLEALSSIEAAILEQGDDVKALLFLWVKIRRHYAVGETIVMSEKDWAAFGKTSKTKVKPLLKVLSNKLGALKLLQSGRVGSSTGRASKYKRLV